MKNQRYFPFIFAYLLFFHASYDLHGMDDNGIHIIEVIINYIVIGEIMNIGILDAPDLWLESTFIE
jgi:hypothetical protein